MTMFSWSWAGREKANGAIAQLSETETEEVAA